MNRVLSPIHFDLSDEEASIIRQCAMEEFRAEATYLRPLGRYGNSEAKLFAARFGGFSERAEYVIKVTSTAKAQDEWSALPYARRYFPEVGNKHAAPDGASVGATIYRLHRHHRDGVVELQDLLVRTRNQAASSTGRIVRVLNRTYSDLTGAHLPTARTIDYGTAYRDYLRPNRDDRVKALLGSEERVSLLGQDYLNPVRVLGLLKDVEARVPHGWAHGDLHPKNVMLSRFDQPALIDFAWFRESDITVDFALMECSLRFLLFPQDVDWAFHQMVNDALLEERGASRVMRNMVEENPLRDAYASMLSAVRTVRNNARAHAGALFNWDHYVASQFLILYGLAKIENYPFFHTTDALARIGQRVAERLSL